VRDNLKLFRDFVVHSLRHTMLRALGEAGADAQVVKEVAKVERPPGSIRSSL